MNSDDRDPLLVDFFSDAEVELDGEIFISRVMAETTKLRYRLFAGLIVLVLVLATFTWFLGIPLEIAQLVSQVLSTPLINLGETWLAFVLSPINHIAGLLVLTAKVVRVFWKKQTGLSYVR